ncbi:hypothetical protein A9Q84_07625 [Halobacteriovorax marinus]|uniref:Uncharacterized protein n=1 Tax=Halobacteriovorax marinus TaxID=97084 RepID=A0A1Y5FB65_9BACT|nr:hypothetical protein A9Q84_07625 [Halobacteriovorax marinus]
MNKISIYILLILIYLGLSKSFSPSEKKAPYIPNEKVFPSYFYGAPISIILLESFQTGFLIKTFFQKYKIIHGFKHPETLIVRTSYSFWEKNKKNVGMSIFRRGERKNTESLIPMPPGILYIGDPAYGHWEIQDSGEKLWFFHRAYRHFPNIFNWNIFRPSEKFYETALTFLTHDKSYYGENGEFGTEGSLTREKLEIKEKESEDVIKSDLKNIIEKTFYIPKWNN